MEDWADLLWSHTWWQYLPADGGYSLPYHWLNLIEGSVWILLAALVLWRYWRRRNSKWELGYAFAFLLFGLSDYREAYVLQTWLIWAKGINLFALFYLRRLIIRCYYPTSRLY
jgi:hypothetical protein